MDSNTGKEKKKSYKLHFSGGKTERRPRKGTYPECRDEQGGRGPGSLGSPALTHAFSLSLSGRVASRCSEQGLGLGSKPTTPRAAQKNPSGLHSPLVVCSL